MAIIEIEKNGAGPTGLFTDVLYYYVTESEYSDKNIASITLGFKQENKEPISFPIDGKECVKVASK